MAPTPRLQKDSQAEKASLIGLCGLLKRRRFVVCGYYDESTTPDGSDGWLDFMGPEDKFRPFDY